MLIISAVGRPISLSQITLLDHDPNAVPGQDCHILCNLLASPPNKSRIRTPVMIVLTPLPYFVIAKDMPRIPIPRKAKAIQTFLLWLKAKLSLNSDKATLAITPDVIANIAP